MINVLLLSLGLISAGPVEWQVNHIITINFQGPIGPVTAEYVRDAIEFTREKGGDLIIMTMDTPGGLDTAMREVIKAIETSPVPFVVYIAPSGARAASAGAFITLASHIAAMAPGTNIGAAHPVNLGGEKIGEELKQKIENDAVAYAVSLAKKHGRNVRWAKDAVLKSISTDAEEALKLHVVEIIAPSMDSLIKQLNGRGIKLNGTTYNLKVNVKTVKRTHFPMSFRLRFLHTLSNPNLAYILLMIGFWGIFFELSHPGAILPGVIGGLSLILAFVAFQTLPVNYAGILLIILGIILFLLELKITSYGLLGLSGTISIFIGSVMLFRAPSPYFRLSWSVLIPTFAVSVGFFGLALYLALKAQLLKPALGFEGLIGEEGEVVQSNGKKCKIFLHGEYWDGVADSPVKRGDKVKAVGRNGMILIVKKIEEG